MATDASTFGLGACEWRGDGELVRRVGSCSERWRFAVEQAVSAREHALHDVDSLDPDVCANICQECDRFQEVPSTLIKGSWTVTHATRVRHPANILHLEAKAAVWGVHHVLRSEKAFGKRILILLDNLPAVLGITKGRASSAHLRGPLQQICAIALATGSRIFARWIPSELNPSDPPSRGVGGFWGTRRDRDGSVVDPLARADASQHNTEWEKGTASHDTS